MSENEKSILNTNSTEINLKEDDTTFNELKELQKLIKKESSIKELFIKTINETKNSIELQCVDIYKKKMEVLNILQKLSYSKSNSENNSQNLLKEYILVENNYDYLSDLSTYISDLLNYLWEEPKILANLLLKANKAETEEFLAPLICNNFYENILSPNYIEDPLIYIIYLLLKNEIDNIQDINEGINNFLNDTPCSYLLRQLIEKSDVKEYFKIILQDALEDLGNDKFIFSIEELSKWQKEQGKTVNKSIFDKNFLSSKNVDNNGRKLSINQIEKKTPDLTRAKTIAKIEIQGITEDDRETIKNNINYQIFTAVYLTSIPNSEIRENINKYQDDISLKSYYEYLLTNTNGDYSQTNFFENMYKQEDSGSILVFYQEHFLKIKEFLNKVLENIISNYRIIPYSIKCVSKIIFQLVNNKFPEANEIQKNLFLSKFLYKTIMFPIFEKPDLNALINDYIISNTTLYNMKIICDIMWTLVSFKLFKDNDSLEGDLTPFNRVFIEIIPEIFKINKIVIETNLPQFIDGLINKNINEEEYHFNYFNENPDKISFYKSMLLNIKQFNSLFSNLMEFKDDLLKPEENNNDKSQKNIESKYDEFKNKSEINKQYLLKISERLNSSNHLKLLSDLVNRKETIKTKNENSLSKSKINEDKKQIVKYFHINELLFNEKSKEIFSLKQKYFYYNIEELKEKDFKNINPKELQIKNNIIKCKNFFSLILYNYRILEKNDFNKGKTNNIMDILKELSHFMVSSNYLIDGTIPSEWYLISLMECLKKLPEDYKNNEYKKLFEELTSDLNESIKKCNFEYMSLLFEGMKFGNRNKNFQEKIKEIYMDIELNNKAKNIIENDNINMSVTYKFTDKKQEFIISQGNISNKKSDFFDYFHLDKIFRTNTIKTIDKFTKDFPNLNEYKFSKENSGETINIFEWQKMLDIPNKMTNFFNNINQYLKNKIKNEKELNNINDKIYDYVMSRIYDKIYPKFRNILDAVVVKNTCKLNWIEPENVIQEKIHYDFDFVLPDINNYFNLIRNEKSPRKKFINLNNIFESIVKLLKFTKGDFNIGIDDQIPLLNYCFIKCKPWSIFTDYSFMKLYISNKKNRIEDSNLTQLFTCINFIKNIEYNCLNSVSEDEYKEKGEIYLKENDEYLRQLNLDDIKDNSNDK